MTKFLFCVALCCFFVALVAAQPKRLTSEEYFAALRKAYAAEGTVARRVVITKGFYKKGILAGTTKTINVYMPPGRMSSRSSWVIDGKLQSRDVIEIEKFYFCRQNNGKWRKTDQFCGTMEISGIPADSVIDYSMDEVVESGHKFKLYQMKAKYIGFDGTARNSEDRTWTDAVTGLTYRAESKIVEEKSGFISSLSRTSYEYNPIGVSIQAPIK